MRRLNGLWLAVMVVFAAVAAMSLSSAFAASPLPQILPIEENQRFTDKSDGTTRLQLETERRTVVLCRKATSSGIQETDTLGQFHISFEGCESGGLRCRSAGDAAEEILTLGSFHYVYDTLGGNEKVAVLFLPQTTSFECVGIRIEVTGNVLCLVLRPLEETRVHLIHCIRGPGAGEQAEKTWWNDNLERQTAELLTSVSGGGRERSSELALAEIIFQRPNAFMND